MMSLMGIPQWILCAAFRKPESSASVYSVLFWPRCQATTKSDAGPRTRFTGWQFNQSWNATAGTNLVVNLFDGGVRGSVWYALNGESAIAMDYNYTVRTDLYIERMAQLLLDSDAAFGNAAQSSHIWQAELPAELELVFIVL